MHLHWHDGVTCRGDPTIEECLRQAVANAWLGRVLERVDHYDDGREVRCYTMVTGYFDHYARQGRFVAETRVTSALLSDPPQVAVALTEDEVRAAVREAMNGPDSPARHGHWCTAVENRVAAQLTGRPKAIETCSRCGRSESPTCCDGLSTPTTGVLGVRAMVESARATPTQNTAPFQDALVALTSVMEEFLAALADRAHDSLSRHERTTLAVQRLGDLGVRLPQAIVDQIARQRAGAS